jgi:hypothetical protein
VLDGRALLPQELQRARCRSRSLDAFAPQQITAIAQASGAVLTTIAPEPTSA